MFNQLLAIAGLLLVTSGSAWAFPENVRHHYLNCTTCHVSPSGGGLLTGYGRELSRELMSTWGRDGEAQFAYGLFKTPEWLNLGGDYRSVYLYRDDPRVRQGYTQFMQADVEAGVTYSKFTLVGSLGYRQTSPTDGSRPGYGAPTGNSLVDHLISRRHYLLYQPTDELGIRVGRFYPQYGLNIPDHYVATRQLPLLWDETFESYNLEASWVGETFNGYATIIRGRPDVNSPVGVGDRDTGWALSGWLPFGDSTKVGANFLRSFNAAQSRTLLGPSAMLGFTSRFYLLTELDLQFAQPTNAAQPSTSGAVNYQKLGFELIQGLHLYASEDYRKIDFKNERSSLFRYGPGIQWFPRPHFEFNLNWLRVNSSSFPNNTTDFIWFLWHYYL